ncbi:MAG: putative caspase-like protein [Myxococcota bacterium]|jgi:uncharacterized caspase-like protein
MVGKGALNDSRYGLCGVALLLATTLPLASQAAEGPRRLAVVVGANVGAPHQVVLRHAAADARKVGQVLTELGGVSEGDLQLLDARPTARKVLAAIHRVERIARKVRAAGQEVSFVFYYSGHATENALQLYDTELPLQGLRERLRQSKAHLRLAVVDACHSGSVIRDKGGNRSRKKVNVAFDQAIGTEGYAILTSSSVDEQSQESDELRGSFFTHHLVSALRGAADQDANGSITLNEAYRYAYERTVRQTSASARVAQHPNFDMSLKGGRDVVLTSVSTSSARLTLTGTADRATWMVYEPDSGTVVAEISEKMGQSVTLAVPAGELEIYRRTGSSVTRGVVNVPLGGEVALSEPALGMEEVTLTAYMAKGEPIGFVFSAQIGIQTFGEDAVRERYVGSVPLFSVALRIENIGAIPGMDLAWDAGITSMSQTLSIGELRYQQQLTHFQTGLTLMYRYDFDNLSLLAGPRVAYMLLHRELEATGLSEYLNTIAVGGAIGAFWRFSQRISVGVTGRVSYVPMFLADVERDQWMVEAQAVGGFHF